MLSPEENELVTRTGAGTPMGEVMRRYWMPAALAWELPQPDCPPIRVKLLGEKLVAFRDTQERVGLIDEFCAHRRASLFLGRNEEGGLRCVYHGWKYDTKGSCLDMPNEPQETNFKHAVRLKAYPTAEMGGLIWAYMGPPEKVPPLPKFEWTQVPENYRHLSKMWQECNWLQALEGAIDNAHAGFLHRALTDKTTRAGLRGYWESSQTPRLDVHLTDYGFMYTATRALPGRELRARLPVRDAFSPVFPVSDPPQRQRCKVEKADGPRPHVRSDERRELHGLQLDVHVCRATADGGGQRTVGPSYRERARRASG